MGNVDKLLSEYRKEDYSLDQLHEIKEGLKWGLDVSLYANPKMMAIQMYQIRLGLMDGVDVSLYSNSKYDWFQMEEIRLGLKSGVDASVYARSGWPFQTMREIRLGLEKGMHLEKFARLDAGIIKELRIAMEENIDIVPYIKKGYNAEQLVQIRYALSKKCNLDPYLNEWFRGASIRQIALGLEKGLDVSVYAKIEYDWHQMEELRTGLEHRIDVERYAKKWASWRQMREIRMGMEQGLDVSKYESLMYSWADMRRIRLQMLEEAGIDNTEISDEPKTHKPETTVETIGKKETNNKISTAVSVNENNSVDNPTDIPTDNPTDIPTDNPETSEFPDIDLDEYKIVISPDQMSGSIRIDEAGFAVETNRLVSFLKEKGILMGFKWDVLAKMKEGTAGTGLICVAQGKVAEKGADGYYEYRLEGKSQYQPVYNEDGSIDFGKSTWYRTVDTGEELVEYHPAKAGMPGFTVTGKTLPAKKGDEMPALSGIGFTILGDKVTYAASNAGVIFYDENAYKLKVVPFLEVDEVNSLNNFLKFDGTIHVKGDVEANSYIEATGDILIDGYVDNAKLKADESVILKRGMNGNGVGSITAGGNIEGLFFEKCNLQARGIIRANYCLNCDANSDCEIHVLGKRGYILGGMCSATDLIHTQALGNSMGNKTVVSVGVRADFLEEERKIKIEIKEINKQIDLLANGLAEFKIKYKPEERNSIPAFIRLEDAIYTKQEELKRTVARQKEIEETKERAEKARIIAERAAFEGTIVEINGVYSNIKTVYKAIFKNTNDKIVLTHLE